MGVFISPAVITPGPTFSRVSFTASENSESRFQLDFLEIEDDFKDVLFNSVDNIVFDDTSCRYFSFVIAILGIDESRTLLSEFQ